MDWRQRLADLVAKGPDPDGAPARLARFFDAGGAVADDTEAALLADLVGQSPALARVLAAEPARLGALARDPYLRLEKPAGIMADEIAAAVDDAGDLKAGLRRHVRGEMLRLGARELGRAAADVVARELAHLADACLDVAVQHATRAVAARLGEPIAVPDDGGAPRRCRFVVFGMGKHGGEELNFSSDVDLVFAYETDHGATATGRSLHEFFARVAERVARALDEHTADGTCFRVDLRLRPEGTRGPLVNALPALERYYESWGRPWERQAWVKARPVAGDRDLGDEILAMLAPFVWPRASLSGSVAVVGEMLRLLAQMRREADRSLDVKLGPGGIREVEFFVQALQLVHGGRQPTLRERGTLRALDKLLFAGLVSEREHRALGAAYQMLRRIEHRLQLEELRQTHSLPATGERDLLGRRLGYPDGAAFDAALDETRAVVSDIFATLEPGHASGASVGVARGHDWDAPVEAHLALDPSAERAERARALARLGFRDAEAACDELERLLARPRSPFAPTAPPELARAAPVLMVDLGDSPDPDLALRRIVDLAARRDSGASVWRLVAGNRSLARLLASLLGTSEFLAKIFIARPELVEPLFSVGQAARRRDRAAHDAALQQRLADAGDDEETRLEALRRYQKDEVLRIGMFDIGGELDVDEVAAELSALAGALLEATLAVVAPAVHRRWARLGPPLPLAVVGLGKLGAGEMSYASDLDVVFVFGDPRRPAVDDVEHFELAARVGQRLIRGLDAYLAEGRLYEVDTRLRPSGQKGALVSSLAGFRAYHAQSAALWERQALVKARAVAGDRELGRAVEQIAAAHVWDGPAIDPAAAAVEIKRLRARLEREVAREQPERGRYHVKAGRGGLVDVQFLVEYLQLVHGPRDPGLRAPATGAALAALQQAGILSDTDAGALAAGWRFLRRVENRMRIVHDRPIADLDVSAGDTDKLARRLGYRGEGVAARFAADFQAHTDRIRALYARILG